MKIFMIAGEASGDIHGYNLATELKKLYPNLELCGTGGAKLKSIGQKQYFTDKDMAIIGFDGVIKKLPFIFKMFRTLEKAVREEKPDAIILVDYPGFNLRMAKRLKKYKIPIIYFIAPQFWVWNYKRIYVLRDFCDLTLSIYPFETDALKNAGVNSVYIGNPIIDNMKFVYEDKEAFLKSAGLSGKKPVIGILPGSRFHEISSLLPIFAEASNQYADKFEFVVSKAANISSEDITKYSAGLPFVSDAQYDIMKYADFIWACSGTVTLETAVMKKPMIIVYKSSRLNFFIAMRLSSLRMVGLPNIINGSLLVPEVLGWDIKPADIVSATEKAFSDIDNINAGLEKISSQFVGMTPCETAAGEIYSLLEKHTKRYLNN